MDLQNKAEQSETLLYGVSQDLINSFSEFIVQRRSEITFRKNLKMDRRYIIYNNFELVIHHNRLISLYSSELIHILDIQLLYNTIIRLNPLNNNMVEIMYLNRTQGRLTISCMDAAQAMEIRDVLLEMRPDGPSSDSDSPSPPLPPDQSGIEASPPSSEESPTAQ